MLARLVRELPDEPGMAYEPKWDGFRCLVFRDGPEVDLRSRNGRPLARYFPELVEAFLALPVAELAIDGEIVVVGRDGLADFAALMARLHPAESRFQRLAAETPASFMAFDVLAVDGDDVRPLTFRDRRLRLEALFVDSVSPLFLTPVTHDPDVASRWLDERPGNAIDGVVAKREDDPYLAGKRTMFKVKRERSADCVVVGFRWYADRPIVGSLLLGLYDDGELRHIGVVTSFDERTRATLAADLAPLAIPLAQHPWRDGFALEGGPMGRLRGAAGRWTPEMPLDWVPLLPELVLEVAYDLVDGIRFRHPARARRWRWDRDPVTCTVEQLLDVALAT